MPTRETAPDGAPCWIDLLSSDVDRSRAFYGELFGWTSEQAGEEYGGYVNFSLGGLPVAGCMGKTEQTQDMPDGWSTYFATDDAQKTSDLATTHGGSVAMPVMPVPEDGTLGHMAFLIDPTGAFFGVWQPGEHKGFGTVFEPGAPSWFELFTPDHDGAVAFYTEVLRWETKNIGDTDEFRYTVMLDPTAKEEAFLAGIMDASSFLPDGVPPHWSVYIGTADADATVAKATQLGGAVVVPAEDTPYGRLATLTDATGAQFKIVQPPADM
jgi:predicted enzyme related to lactoylglutathione lyase